MNIVIAGKFSPPVLACIRSWARDGHRVGFVNLDDGCLISPCSRYLDRQAVLSSALLFRDKGILELKGFLEKFEADVLSCVDDKVACWLSDNTAVFDAKPALALPPSGMIRKILSKRFQNQLAAKVGFTVLPEYIIDKYNKESLSIHARHFPLCLRPSESAHVHPGFKVEQVRSSGQLDEFLRTKDIHEKGAIIAQPYKNLPNLVVHGIRTKTGDVRRLSSFLVEKKFEGVTLTIRPYPVGSGLLDKCAQFVESAGLTGNFHFEFLFDPGTREAFFLEINLRFGGTTAKVLACGYDEPMYALEAYGLSQAGKGIHLKNRIVSNKQALVKYMAKAAAGKLSPLDYPDEPLSGRIAAGIKGLFCFRDEVICLDDWKGSLSLYLGNILAQFNLAQRH